MKRKIVADGAPEPGNGIFSNCLVVGDTVYLSGQHAGASQGGGLLGDGSVASQTREAFKKIKALVEAAGGRMDDIVKLTFYITDIARRQEASNVRREFFTGDMPCSTLVGVTALSAPGLVVEIDAVAVLGAGARVRAS